MESLKIGFGGGCHWCTEGIFRSLQGVTQVEQGWISAVPPEHEFSEGVIVHFQPRNISLQQLIDIHILTHSAYSDHALREKYRSALYVFSESQRHEAQSVLRKLAQSNSRTLITRALIFKDFRVNKESYLDYFYQDPERPFCQTQIKPKLEKLARHYPDSINTECREVINQKVLKDKDE